MPVVQITYIEGRDPAAVKACVKAVALVVHETLGAPLDAIHVFATSIPPQHWAVGDVTRDEPAGTAARASA